MYPDMARNPAQHHLIKTIWHPKVLPGTMDKSPIYDSTQPQGTDPRKLSRSDVMSQMNSIDLKKILSFPFQKEEARGRFLVGSLLVLSSYFIPLLPFVLVAGYLLRIIRQAIDDDDLQLPAWDDWGTFAVDGLKVSLVGMVYMLPGLLVYFVGMGFYFIGIFSSELMTQTSNYGSASQAGLPLVLFASMLVLFLSLFIGSLLTFLGGAPLPIATSHLAAKNRLAAAFQVGEWWKIFNANKSGYLIALIFSFGLAALLYLGTMLVYYSIFLCCLIPLLTAPAAFYVSVVSSALFGSTYRDSLELLENRDEG
jgi:hypothetical protein